MSIRAATMSHSYSSTTRNSGFLGKLVVALLFVVVIACFMALFETYQRNISIFWMAVLAAMIIGLATGTISRMVFYSWSGFVRFFVTLLTLPVGMFVLGIFTSWQIGIGPLEPWFQGFVPQDELVQLGSAFLVALVSLEAWWKPASRTESVPIRTAPRRRREPQARASMQSVQSEAPQVHHQENPVFLPPRRTSHLKLMRANRARSRTSPAVERLHITNIHQPVRAKSRRSVNRKPKLQISTFEEHRCPFCLEEVKRNDPRGIKECEICHSLHHADCWAITGMCQVPHLN
jgi:hypothetical protein